MMYSLIFQLLFDTRASKKIIAQSRMYLRTQIFLNTKFYVIEESSLHNQLYILIAINQVFINILNNKIMINIIINCDNYLCKYS